MTVDQIKELNGVEIPEGKNYSEVITSALKNTFSLKSKSGIEYIFIADPGSDEGEVFYHSDCKPTFVRKEINLGEKKIYRDELTGPAPVFVKPAPQNFEELKELLKL